MRRAAHTRGERHASKPDRRGYAHAREELSDSVPIGARVSFVKVAAYQRRGVVHFHALIRLDAPGDDYHPAAYP